MKGKTMDEKTEKKWLAPYEINVCGTSEILSINPGMIARLINPEASLEECISFLLICRSVGANPFLKDVHLVKYSKDQKEPAAFVSGIGFFEKKAQLNPKFKGYGPTLWMDKNGEWQNVFIKENHGAFPLACLVSCHVDGYEQRQEQVVTWDEAKGTKKDGSLTKNWRNMPATMLEKVGKVRLLRKLFSAELGGLYTHEELHQDVDQAPIEIGTANVVDLKKLEQKSKQEDKANDKTIENLKSQLQELCNICSDFNTIDETHSLLNDNGWSYDNLQTAISKVSKKIEEQNKDLEKEVA